MPYEISADGLSNLVADSGPGGASSGQTGCGQDGSKRVFSHACQTASCFLFHYDRFCINLYDAEREFLNLFTAADGTVVESLSNTRIAQNTVAGLAIASRKACGHQ